jgi:hypothetical protein
MEGWESGRRGSEKGSRWRMIMVGQFDGEGWEIVEGVCWRMLVNGREEQSCIRRTI